MKVYLEDGDVGTRRAENVVVCSVVDWSYVTGSLAVTVHVEFEVRWTFFTLRYDRGHPILTA